MKPPLFSPCLQAKQNVESERVFQANEEVMRLRSLVDAKDREKEAMQVCVCVWCCSRLLAGQALYYDSVHTVVLKLRVCYVRHSDTCWWQRC